MGNRFFFLFWDRVSCSSGWPRTSSVVEGYLNSAPSLAFRLSVWDHRHMLPFPAVCSDSRILSPSIPTSMGKAVIAVTWEAEAEGLWIQAQLGWELVLKNKPHCHSVSFHRTTCFWLTCACSSYIVFWHLVEHRCFVSGFQTGKGLSVVSTSAVPSQIFLDRWLTSRMWNLLDSNRTDEADLREFMYLWSFTQLYCACIYLIKFMCSAP